MAHVIANAVAVKTSREIEIAKRLQWTHFNAFRVSNEWI